MTTLAPIHEQQAEMADRVIREALDIVRLEGRLAELAADAIERAPAVAAWWSARLALTRLP